MSPFCVGTISGQGTQGTLTASLAAYSGATPTSWRWISQNLPGYCNPCRPVALRNGSAPAAHGTGSQFSLLTNANVFKFTPPTNTSLIGQTVYFKFQSFNIYGSATQDISTCTAFPYTVTEPGSQVPFTIQASAAGTLSANQSVLRYIAAENFFIPAGLTGTVVSEGTAATSTATFTLAKNGTAFGTIAIAPTGAVTLTTASQKNFTAGDVLTLTAPATPDPMLANVAIGIGAVRM